MPSASTYAYLYKWTQISTGKWYIGSRTATGCHPDDGYICSSKQVKPMIQENSNDWQRQVLCIGPAAFIRDLETSLLVALNAAADPASFNLHNGVGLCARTGIPHSPKSKARISQASRKYWNDANRKSRSEAYKGKPAHNKGIPWSESSRMNHMRFYENNIVPEERREKMRNSNRKLSSWEITTDQRTFVITSLRKFTKDNFYEKWRTALSALQAGYAYSGMKAKKLHS